MARSDSQIDKPQGGRPKRAELPDVNRNTVAQSSNTDKTNLPTLCGPHLVATEFNSVMGLFV